MPEEESRADAAYKKLEEDIVTLKLKPGEAVTENQLTRDFDMGRTPIREAIQRLSWEGLVVIRPRLGIIIADINPSDFSRVLEARHALEELLARSAARLASKSERQALHDCAKDMRTAASEPDVQRFLQLDKQFDELVAKAACNPFASKAVAPLQTLSRRFWFRYFGETDLNPAAWSHLELMQAIEAGDEKSAVEKADDLMHYLRRQAAALVATAAPSA
ncbi:transcriptional regulator, GntR family [Roseibium hamelinense]|uniref:Transcriptional regulator, GntR family n=1 Tax=Roseibium hamelinense TaxID=150831 RepID=A0A562SMP5_9HYPH|nr:GntR family transcriptional regulator [Roseibium hamelinense]MTI44913.1 GntR family transcriptional regulator [Roseibium hamelinense]TWI82174.1 transcriptional regulator, GntR family [Roseibium hamelinense]